MSNVLKGLTRKELEAEATAPLANLQLARLRERDVGKVVPILMPFYLFPHGEKMYRVVGRYRVKNITLVKGVGEYEFSYEME